MWELTFFLTHYHPSVRAFSAAILEGESISYTGNPFFDFSDIAFIEKYVLKKPKKTLLPIPGDHVAQTESSFKIPDVIEPDETFFYEFFKQKAERGMNKKKRSKKKKGSDDDLSNEEEEEEEEEEKLDNFLDAKSDESGEDEFQKSSKSWNKSRKNEIQNEKENENEGENEDEGDVSSDGEGDFHYSQLGLDDFEEDLVNSDIDNDDDQNFDVSDASDAGEGVEDEPQKSSKKKKSKEQDLFKGIVDKSGFADADKVMEILERSGDEPNKRQTDWELRTERRERGGGKKSAKRGFKRKEGQKKKQKRN